MEHGASSPPNSTLFGFGGTKKIKDSRQLHDKSFVQQCIKQLHEFLTEQGYPGTFSVKTLQSPSTKEFLKMFEFIFCQLDPTFKMPNSKVEEEVPALLKAFRYPFVLSKSCIYSVGAQHSWPQALGALMWLIDTVKINRSLSKQELLSSDVCEDTANIEEGAEYNKLVLDYMAETYSKFMHGEDVFEDEDEALLTKLKRLYNVDEVRLESMEENHRFLSEELERLEKESQTDRLMTKRMEKEKLQEDLEKLQCCQSKLESYTASLENKCSEVTDELENTVSHLETLKHERNELQNLLQNQKFTPAEVRRINWEKRDLQETIDRLSKSLEVTEQHKWNEEITLAKVKEKLELKVAEYHELARKLKLIPMSAENACGYDFEIRTSKCGTGSGVQLCRTKMVLRKLIADAKEENSRLLNCNLNLEECCQQLSFMIMDKSEDLKQIREQIHKLDEQLDTDMQKMAQEEEYWAAEIKFAEDLLQNQVNGCYDEAVQALKRKSLDDFHSRVQHLCSKAIEEDEAELQKLREVFKSFQSEANCF